ncbi:response regulator receiver protein [Thioploca ingrica]|uniref:histidine kinase n=1 Tax=Thioploca ingrica TaxID=40754 RepID=A0A090ACY3_9GAMM|nr:response regulator receiver protein [Thioploca ingrica]
MNQTFQILIVDDNPHNLQVLGNTLKSNGYYPLFAKSAHQAFKVLQEKKPQLILLDIMMPEIDGFEVCQRLKADDNTKDIPIIFLTAYADKETIIQGFQLGAVDYVTKPFNTEELITRIQTHLKLKTTEEQLKQKIKELEIIRQELISTVIQLKEANATKDKFFSIIAHDLGNLFTGLIGLSDLLIEGSPVESHNNDDLWMLHNFSNRGFNLLKNLLEWSRLQTGKIKAQPEIMNLELVVNTDIDLLTPQLASKNIRCSVALETKTVWVDGYMLNTVLRNLLANAVKFTPRNGKIEIRSHTEGTEVEISVKDTGVGIGAAELDKLFRIDVHHTTRGTAGESGTGLGLILCKEFVEKNHGTIGVKSELGKGSQFYIRLPAVLS